MSEITPLMKQYKEIKSMHEEEILMFRLGDFYEMFYNDAVIASKVLGLTLTKRNREKGVDIPLAGVPYHSVNQYINKLVNSGHKVAICEQVEDPKKAKGIVKREVVKIITPGTIIDIENLDSSKNNFIASIIIEQQNAYLAYLDITTGLFNALKLDFENIQTYIYMLDIKEIVSTKQTIEKIYEFIQGKNISIEQSSKPKKANNFLCDYFDLVSLDSFGLDDKNLIDSCAMLLEYILDTQKNIDLNITKINVLKDDNYAEINMNTSKNLELIKNQKDKTSYGTLFYILDKCKTSMGSRLLRNYINYPLINLNDIYERQQDIEFLISNLLIKEDLSDSLKETYDIERLLSKLIFGTQNARDLRAISQTIKKYYDISKIWEIKFKDFDFKNLLDLSNFLEESLNEDLPFSVREGGMINPNFNDETKELNDILKNGRQYLLKIENEEKEKTGIKNLKIKYNKIFGYFIEISKSNISEVPERYIRKQTLSNCERYITEELKVYEDKIINAKSRLVELEYQILLDLSEKLKVYKDTISNLAKVVAYIDVMLSFANVSIENNYVKPKFNSNNEIHILKGRHPIVEKLIETQFIENDVHFTKEKNFIILTGPNMAGKSTYMKQIALICIMAQIGCFVPAASANLCIVDKFLTRIGASDDIISGQSTFMVEMSEVSHILNSATNRSLVILDEVGRGTSTYDGLSLASAISTYIHDNIGAKTIFATHYHELNELEQNHSRVINYRINVEEKNSKVIFLRTISMGSADKSYGNYVAKLAGLPNSVLRQSKQILSKLEKRHILIQKTETIGQLSLFDNPSYIKYSDDNEKKIEKYEEITKYIEDIDINNTTPLKAMSVLNELKEFIKSIDDERK